MVSQWRTYELVPKAQAIVSRPYSELTSVERETLRTMGFLREVRFISCKMAEPTEEFYQEEENIVVWLYEPDLGILYVPPPVVPAFDPDLKYAASKGLRLFPFQEIGIQKLQGLVRGSLKRSQDGRGGACLFDDMGLGKTMEGIAFAAKMSPPPKKVLVICPNTLKIEWRNAISTWLEGTCEQCAGTGESRSVGEGVGEGSLKSSSNSNLLEGLQSGEGSNQSGISPSGTQSSGEVGDSDDQDGEGVDSTCPRCRGGGVSVAVFATGRGGLRRFNGLAEAPGWRTAAMKWLITNYESMRTPQYMEILQAFNPDLLIFDEAHRLRNWERKTARASRKLVADVEIPMTGTPVVNHAGDLWALVSRVAPDLVGSATSFEETYTYSRSMGRGVKRYGVRNGEQLKELLAKVAIQRKKEEVLADLPPKVYREVPLEMENGQRELYEAMERQLFIMLDDGMSLQANSVLALLMRLRQLCCDPRILGAGRGKFVLGSELGLEGPAASELFKTGESVGVKTDFLLEFLEDLGEEPLVVFSNFERYISLIEVHLKEKGYSYVRLTGKEIGDERAANIQTFQRGDVQVILGTTQAAGEGINLQRASKVVLLDRWWSPVRNEQAVDRLHRIGQLGSVQVILPHCVESIDDALKETLGRKLTVINELRIRGDTVDLMRKRRQRGS